MNSFRKSFVYCSQEYVKNEDFIRTAVRQTTAAFASVSSSEDMLAGHAGRRLQTSNLHRLGCLQDKTP
jgi:hypothetical protein